MPRNEILNGKQSDTVSARFDLPMVENENEPFWTAVENRRLLIGSCSDCGEFHYYPRPHCPHCWSDNVEWVDASGKATLYTWSVIYRNDLPPWPQRVPYVAAVVELAEGPKMMTQILESDGSNLSIGMALELDFEALDEELTIAVFRCPG